MVGVALAWLANTLLQLCYTTHRLAFGRGGCGLLTIGCKTLTLCFSLIYIDILQCQDVIAFLLYDASFINTVNYELVCCMNVYITVYY